MKQILAAVLMCGAAFAQEKAAPVKPNVMDPASLKARAPETFKAKFTTTKGDFVIQVTRAWAPNGADRFYNLVRSGFFKDAAFFRVLSGFMAQFGIPADPAVARVWMQANITDDPVKASNKRGFVTFAQTSARNSRSTQLFINYGDNSRLDADRFAPFGEVVEGMDVVDKFYSGYGEGAPGGAGPDQGRLQSQGKAYLDRNFPKLDHIISATIVP
jgi:peptidyl-prolyl cis-trans isomerase A (cyclophilin A)